MRRVAAQAVVLLLGAGIIGAQPIPAPVASAPDTTVARFSWAGPGERPATLVVWPDEARFGQEIVVILDHEDGARPQPLDSLRVDVPWLEKVGAAGATELPLPPPEGPRQLARYRVYREGPWRAAWQDGPPGAVQLVTGRVDDLSEVAPVRDPRPMGGLPAWVLILVLAVAFAALLGLFWWRWRRGRRRSGPGHRALPAPAWLAAAVRLQELEQEALLARDHLDGLASVLRRYLHGRFLLRAEEMTAGEVLAAARAAGWQRPEVAAFAALLADCDDARYAPDHVGAQRRQACIQRAIDLVDAVRVQPRWTPVAATELAEAHAAWERLRQRYPAVPDGDERSVAC